MPSSESRLLQFQTFPAFSFFNLLALEHSRNSLAWRRENLSREVSGANLFHNRVSWTLLLKALVPEWKPTHFKPCKKKISDTVYFTYWAKSLFFLISMPFKTQYEGVKLLTNNFQDCNAISDPKFTGLLMRAHNDEAGKICEEILQRHRDEGQVSTWICTYELCCKVW